MTRNLVVRSSLNESSDTDENNKISMAIVVDSSVSLPDDCSSFDFLYLVPMNINIDGNQFIDESINSFNQFYTLMKGDYSDIKTSSPSPNSYLSVFNKIISKSIKKIICVTVASRLSASNNSALIAANQITAKYSNSVDIAVFDSKSAAAGEGLIVLQICEMVKKGICFDRILLSVQLIVENTKMLGSIENLRYAWKSGRIPKLAYWGSNVLGIKPVFELDKGYINLLSKPRTIKKVNEKFISYLLNEQVKGDLYIAVMHADALENAQLLIGLIKAKVKYKEMFLTTVSPIVGAYAGPGMIGVAYCMDYSK